MNETAQLAKFTAEMTYDKLPAQAVAVAKQCILDWLGVAIRGAHEEPAKILRSVALKMCSTGDATVFDGGSRRIDAYNAAMVNGAASHTLDFDDLHNASIIHLACWRRCAPVTKQARVPAKRLYRNPTFTGIPPARQVSLAVRRQRPPCWG